LTAKNLRLNQLAKEARLRLDRSCREERNIKTLNNITTAKNYHMNLEQDKFF